MSYKAAIVKYLQSIPREQGGGWVPEFHLGGRVLGETWVGSRGPRDARDLAANTNCRPELENKVERHYGAVLIEHGRMVDAIGRKVVAKEKYFRAITPKSHVVYSVNGEVVRKVAVYQ